MRSNVVRNSGRNTKIYKICWDVFSVFHNFSRRNFAGLINSNMDCDMVMGFVLPGAVVEKPVSLTLG
jgi:hypothetical protein